MDPTATPSPETHEQLRSRFLAHAAAAFDLMFRPEHQADLHAFSQREQRASELSRDLATWLLQQQLERDPLACLADDANIACPRCSRPTCPASVKDKTRLKRTLTTRVGPISFHRQKWHCKICRISFFTSR